MTLPWSALEAVRCLKAIYSFWGSNLRKYRQTLTILQELLADMRNLQERAAHLINHGDRTDPQWGPTCGPPVPAEDTQDTFSVFTQTGIKTGLSVHISQFLLRFR